MKVHINPKQFLDRFRVATSLTPRHSSTPLLETVRLEVGKGGQAKLLAQSLDAELIMTVPVLRVVIPGAIQLPAEGFSKLLRQTRAGSIAIERPPQEKPASAGPGTRSEVATVQVDGETTTLQTFDPEDFRPRPQEKTKEPVSLRAWRLARLIRQTHFATDEASTRYTLGGCHISHKDGCLHVVASDGHRLADAFEPAPVPTPSTMRARPRVRKVGSRVVSARALRVLLQVLDQFQNVAVTVGFSTKGQFRAVADAFSFTAKPLEGRFPTWESIAPTSPLTIAEVQDPQALRRLLGGSVAARARGEPVELRLIGRYLVVKQPGQGVETRSVVRVPCPITDEVSAVVRMGDALDYLAAVKAPFSLAFPAERRQPLVFESDGLRYYVMPEDEAPHVGASPATDESVQHQPDEEGSSVEETPSVEVLSVGAYDDGTSTGEAAAG